MQEILTTDISLTLQGKIVSIFGHIDFFFSLLKIDIHMFSIVNILPVSWTCRYKVFFEDWLPQWSPDER